MEKVCVNHPESPSVGSCKACEKPVCLMCITEVQGVSFCSDACGAAYQEVKDWLERPAAEEEWNPLADAKPKPAPAAKAPAPMPPPEPEAVPMPVGDTTGERMANALDTALPAPPSAREEAPAPNRMPLYIGIAAGVLVVVGLFIAFSGGDTPEEPPKTEIAKVDPPKPPPPPPVKVDPPKPPPVKVEPPKPEPVKVEPPKPVVVVPPPPVKIEPPKPVVVPPPPPPPVKVEPAKVEPPKPVVVAPPPPPPPVKVEPPKPPPVKVDPPKPEPPPAPHLAFLRDPWGKEKTGAWYRVKTTTAGKDRYKDVGLRESGSGYRVLVSQASADGKTEPEQFTWTEPEEVSVFGSVNGDVKGAKYAADVVRTKASKPSQFVFKDGPHAGAFFASDAVLAKLESETVKVKSREFACTVMETEAKDGKKGEKTWFSSQLGLAVVKWEGDGTTSTLVDFGDDWEKRPPFPGGEIAKVVPPPPPPPVKVDPVVVPPPPPVKVEPPKPVVPPPPPPVKADPAVVPPPPPPVKVEPPKPVVPVPVVPVPPPPPPPPPPVKADPAKVEPPKPPPPPPPKVDTAKQEAEARAKKSMADASALIKEASPMYVEISNAMDELPSDKAALRDLYRKAERVQLKLSDARILYSGVRGDAPDPALVDRRVKQLDEVLEGVQEALKALRSRID